MRLLVSNHYIVWKNLGQEVFPEKKYWIVKRQIF